jgi:hypothetical protein
VTTQLANYGLTACARPPPTGPVTADAVGPVVLAALDEGIRERVRFILAAGGYHDINRALRVLTTGWFEHAGR